MPQKPPMVPALLAALVIGCGVLALGGCGGKAPAEATQDIRHSSEVVLVAPPAPEPVIVIEDPVPKHLHKHEHKHKHGRPHED